MRDKFIRTISAKCHRNCGSCVLNNEKITVQNYEINEERKITICDAICVCGDVVRNYPGFKEVVNSEVKSPAISIQSELLRDFYKSELDCFMGNCKSCPLSNATRYGTACNLLNKCGKKIDEIKRIEGIKNTLISSSENKEKHETMKDRYREKFVYENQERKSLGDEIEELERRLQEKKAMYNIMQQERLIYTSDVQETTFMSNRQVHIDGALLVNNPITYRYELSAVQNGNVIIVELINKELNLRSVAESKWDGIGSFSYQSGVEIALLKAKSKMNHEIIKKKYINI